jgi:hypothetical protein
VTHIPKSGKLDYTEAKAYGPISLFLVKLRNNFTFNKIFNKAYKAFRVCRRTLGKTWGLKPKMLYWIYTVIVRLIVTYAATIRWPRVKLKTSQAEFSKLQKMACLGITEAMKTTPRTATEVLLGLPSYTCRWNLKILDIHT